MVGNRGGWWFDGFRAEIGVAIRSLRTRPLVTAVVAMTLALGIGANTAVFSIVHAVLIRPLPLGNPDMLVRVAETRPDPSVFGQTSMPNYLDWRENTVLSGMAGFFGGPRIDTSRELPERIIVGNVTPDFFPVVQVAPVLGRAFTSDESRAEAPVAVLSHAYWQTVFAGDSGVIGQQLTLNGDRLTVVGVMGPEVAAIEPFNLDLLMPIADAPRDFWARGVRFLRVVGRLSPGVTIESARGEFDTIARRLANDYPDANQGRGIRVAPMADAVAGNVRTPLVFVFAAAGVVLLIACANIATLLMSRAMARRREFALRAALGAGRGRLLRLVMTESLLLGGLGGGCGLLVAEGLRRVFLDVAPAIPRLATASLNVTVLTVATLISIGSAVLFGMLPALRVSVTSPHGALTMRGQATSVRSGLLRTLVAAQVTLALTLLVAGGLLIQSFSNLMGVDPGYDPRGVVSMRVTLPTTRYPDAASRELFWDQLLARTAGIPGVAAAAASALPVLARGSFSATLHAAGPVRADSTSGGVWPATPGYFTTLRVDVLGGRAFSAADRTTGVPVAILNETAARRMFGNEPAVGRRVTFANHLRPDEGPREIVGVVRDVRAFGLDAEVPAQMYIPQAQWGGTVAHLTVRSRSGEPGDLVGPLRRAIAAIDGSLPVDDVMTVPDRLANSVHQPRFYTITLGAFALAALILTAAGVYGVISYSVTQRLREIGIRLALGASVPRMVRLVLKEAMVPTAFGIVTGLTGGRIAGSLLETQLFGVGAGDARIALTASAVIVLVAAVACLFPARRIIAVDPVSVLDRT